MKKFMRWLRREICRFIVGFDNCPADYQKNYQKKILEILWIAANGIFWMMIFFALIIKTI